ncbi:IS3 family transposase, partial [Staphylococcus equorum]|uniref:IS3 family transposase n=1 Tax=Staphylococcus equorum TaxID=246432 RepID=UPI0024081020
MNLVLELREQFSLKILCKVSNLAKSVFYYWLNKLTSEDNNKELKEEIKKICSDANYVYGYRRVTLVLNQRGYCVNHKKVLKLMKHLNLTCTKFTKKRRKYNSYKGKVGRIAKNLIRQRFYADRPFQKYVTDITQFSINNEIKLYLSPVMDLYSSEIISYKMSEHPTLDIVISPLEEAIKQRPSLRYRATFHSDQGWHYQHKQYTSILNEHKIFQSMSRKGNCLDNSPMENFFGLLKQEMYYGEKFKNVEELKQNIQKYIYFYNNERIKSKLKGLSPTKYR